MDEIVVCNLLTRPRGEKWMRAFSQAWIVNSICNLEQIGVGRLGRKLIKPNAVSPSKVIHYIPPTDAFYNSNILNLLYQENLQNS